MMGGPGEPVAFPRDRLDQLAVAQGFPECVDVMSEVVFFDDGVGPDG